MAKENNSCCEGMGCCRVEAVISVDERGQMVLPKETREKAGIHAGDKLALVSWENNGKVACMFLIKAEGIAEMIRGMLGPIAKEILK